jgi:hypothetical protein
MSTTPPNSRPCPKPSNTSGRTITLQHARRWKLFGPAGASFQPASAKLRRRRLVWRWMIDSA